MKRFTFQQVKHRGCVSKKNLIGNQKLEIETISFQFSASLTLIGHPFGSVLSGLISDKFGRRRALMIVVAPAVLAFIMLGSSHSFILVCLSFFSLSFIFGLKGIGVA